MHFLGEYIWISVPNGPADYQFVVICSNNSLVPNKPQAIIWTNSSLDYSRIYASLGFNELIPILHKRVLFFLNWWNQYFIGSCITLYSGGTYRVIVNFYFDPNRFSAWQFFNLWQRVPTNLFTWVSCASSQIFVIISANIYWSSWVNVRVIKKSSHKKASDIDFTETLSVLLILCSYRFIHSLYDAGI